jgi:hypothetical protein
MALIVGRWSRDSLPVQILAKVLEYYIMTSKHPYIYICEEDTIYLETPCKVQNMWRTKTLVETGKIKAECRIRRNNVTMLCSSIILRYARTW